MDKSFPKIPLPSLANLTTLINYAPQPVRPLAERLLKLLHPFHDSDDVDSEISDDSNMSESTNSDTPTRKNSRINGESGKLDLSSASLRSIPTVLEVENTSFEDGKHRHHNTQEKLFEEKRDTLTLSKFSFDFSVDKRGTQMQIELTSSRRDNGPQDEIKHISSRTSERRHRTKHSKPSPPEISSSSRSTDSLSQLNARLQELRSTSSSPSTKPMSRTSSSKSLLSTRGINHPYSPSISPSVMVGSEFKFPIKTQLYPHEIAHVTEALATALLSNFFNMWPTYRDERAEEARRAGRESGIWQRVLSEEEKKGKDRLLAEWKLKPERDIKGRDRYREGNSENYRKNKRCIEEEGKGYESVLEARELRRNDMFRPTIIPTLMVQGDEYSSIESEYRDEVEEA